MDRRRTYAMFAIVTLTAALGGLTQTAMNSMLSGVQASFGTPESVSQWLTTIYMLVIGITVPLVTHLARRYAVRTLIFAALAFMLVGALVAALAPGFAILLAARVLQAISTGIMLPVMQTIAMTRFPAGQHAMAMGIAGIALGFAPNIGPLFGGLLVDSWGWRSFFWILAGIIVALALATLAFVRKRVHEEQEAHLDYLSALLSTIGFGCVLLSFSTAAYRPVSDPTIWVGIIVGVLCIVWFIVRQRRVEFPLISMSIFQSRTYVVSFVAQNLLNASFMGITLIVPLFVQGICGLSALDAGIVFVPATVIALFLNPLAGLLTDRVGARAVTVTGAVLLGVGAASMMFVDAATPLWLLTAMQAVRALGVSTLVGPLNSWGLSGLLPANTMDGSVFFATARQVCASLGTALMMLLVVSVPASLALAGMGGAEAAVWGYRAAFALSAALSLAVLIVAVWKIR